MSDEAATNGVTQPQPSIVLSYLQLFRAPNVFTSIADVAMGFLVVHGSLQPASGFLCLMVASCLLYTAGMVLNDVYDFDVDKEERPDRPLPSGRISRTRAMQLGYWMLAAGVTAATVACFVERVEGVPLWRSGAIAVALAACVILYDAVLKKTVLGPVMMGGCRFFNVLLGMSTAAVGATGNTTFLTFDRGHEMIAAGIGLYIVGVTWFARTEARTSSRWLLAFGTALMASGIVLLAAFPRFTEFQPTYYRINPDLVWPGVLLMFTIPIFRRCLVAIASPTPQHVQAGVKQAILSLILLDAAVCLLVAPWYWAVAVLALYVPTLTLGRWVYST